MQFHRYVNVDEFKAVVLPLLFEDEVINNLPIGIVSGSNMNTASFSTADWLLSVVTDDSGDIVLIAICTKPYCLLLYEPKGKKHKDSIKFLISQLERIDFMPPGVFAPFGLAKNFVETYDKLNLNTGKSINIKMHKTLVLMKLEKLADYKDATGSGRVLTEDDLTFVPFWEQAFCIDCQVPTFTLEENKERIQTRIGKDTHFIWEDGLPVSQAVYGRETPDGAVINWVYTPPLYRGRGYATSVVAQVVKSIFKQGKSYCCLFADTQNKTSCAVYRKLGFYDVCEFDEIHFS